MGSGVEANSKMLGFATLWANLGLTSPTEKSATSVATCAVLTGQELVMRGPLVCVTIASSSSA